MFTKSFTSFIIPSTLNLIGEPCLQCRRLPCEGVGGAKVEAKMWQHYCHNKHDLLHKEPIPASFSRDQKVLLLLVIFLYLSLEKDSNKLGLLSFSNKCLPPDMQFVTDARILSVENIYPMIAIQIMYLLRVI